MTLNSRNTYYEAFYLFIEDRNGSVNKALIKPALNIFFTYIEEKEIDLLSLTFEETEEFLLWYQTEEKDLDTYDRLFHIMMLFYTLLIEAEQAKTNPFEQIRDREMQRLLVEVKKRFPNKKFFNAKTGEEL